MFKPTFKIPMTNCVACWAWHSKWGDTRIEDDLMDIMNSWMEHILKMHWDMSME